MLVSERYIFIKLTLEGICIVLLYAFPSRVIFYGSSRNSTISATCCLV